VRRVSPESRTSPGINDGRQPDTEPVTVQRRASNCGVVMVVGQKVALGRAHAHRTLTIHV
jgi:hypothetical protein